jgi:hypothetical protein
MDPVCPAAPAADPNESTTLCPLHMKVMSINKVATHTTLLAHRGIAAIGTDHKCGFVDILFPLDKFLLTNC